MTRTDTTIREQLLSEPDAFVQARPFDPAWAQAEASLGRRTVVQWGTLVAVAAVLTLVATAALAPMVTESSSPEQPVQAAAASGAPAMPAPSRVEEPSPPGEGLLAGPLVTDGQKATIGTDVVPRAPMADGTLLPLMVEATDGLLLQNAHVSCGGVDRWLDFDSGFVAWRVPSGSCSVQVVGATGSRSYTVEAGTALTCRPHGSSGFRCGDEKDDVSPGEQLHVVSVELHPDLHASSFEVKCDQSDFRNRAALGAGRGTMRGVPDGTCVLYLVGAGTKKRFRFSGSRAFECFGQGSDLICR